MLYTINGYWKDDKAEFSNRIITDYHTTPEGIDEDKVFYCGLSEDDIKEAIALGVNTVHDFVITSYDTYKPSKTYTWQGVDEDDEVVKGFWYSEDDTDEAQTKIDISEEYARNNGKDLVLVEIVMVS